MPDTGPRTNIPAYKRLHTGPHALSVAAEGPVLGSETAVLCQDRSQTGLGLGLGLIFLVLVLVLQLWSWSYTFGLVSITVVSK